MQEKTCVLYSGLILRGENFEVFVDLFYPRNFNHENFQAFYLRDFNGIYLMKWSF